MKPAGKQIISTIRPAAATAALCFAVAASLVAFPSVLPWMIAAWLVAFTFRAARGQTAWLPLVAVMAILLVKRVYLYPALVALQMGIIGTALFDIWATWRKRRERLTSWDRLSIVVLWLCWLGVLWQGGRVSHRAARLAFDPHRPIVCLGDSLTSGIAPDGGYPQELAKLLSVRVVDRGEEGITIEQGSRLLASVAKQQPQAVVIELGGHDFLKGADRAATRARLLALIRQVRNVGAEPILVEIPRGFMTDPYAGLERELAHQQDLQLVADTPIRLLVIRSPFAPPGMWMQTGHLSSDGLHPNAAGNRELARAIADALQCVFGPSIRNAAARSDQAAP